MTDKLEIHIINISKTLMEYKNTPNDKIAQWMYFFENPQAQEVSNIMENNKSIKKANKDLRDLCKADELWYETLNSEMARMDEYQRMQDATQAGIEQGRRETAKSFKKLGVDIDTIAKATGLSIEEIEKL